MAENLPFTPKVKKLLTRPVISMKADGAECYVRIQSALHEGKMRDDGKDKAGEKKKPALLLDVIDLTNGQESQVVASAVLVSTLTEEYEDGSYVGKCFHFKNLGKKESAGGSRYNRMLIEEIDDPTADTGKKGK